jgi:ATP-dependent protease Clp ATPase subunit
MTQCNFCGKPNTAVWRVITAPTAAICNECVARFEALLNKAFDDEAAAEAEYLSWSIPHA